MQKNSVLSIGLQIQLSIAKLKSFVLGYERGKRAKEQVRKSPLFPLSYFLLICGK